MSKVITFSRYFQKTHPKAGEPTYFVEAILTQLGIKYKTGNYFIWLIKNNPDISEIFLMKFFDSLKSGVSPKSNTIRNHKRPVQIGNFINPKCWAGKPYNKTEEGFWQIKFAPDIEIKKIWDVNIKLHEYSGDRSFVVHINNNLFCCAQIPFMHKDNDFTFNGIKLAANDGLAIDDFIAWFDKLPFGGQIICWNESINY